MAQRRPRPRASQLGFLIRAFCASLGAIAGTALFARGVGSLESVAAALAVAGVGYGLFHLGLRRTLAFMRSAPPEEEVAAARRRPRDRETRRRRRPLLTDPAPPRDEES